MRVIRRIKECKTDQARKTVVVGIVIVVVVLLNWETE
jgi:hypothetical protein